MAGVSEAVAGAELESAGAPCEGGVWGGGASLYFSYSVTNVGEFFTINRGKNPPKCSACVELLKYLQTYLALIITNYVIL